MNTNAFKSPHRVDAQRLGRLLYILTLSVPFVLSSLPSSFSLFYSSLFALKKRQSKEFTFSIK